MATEPLRDSIPVIPYRKGVIMFDINDKSIAIRYIQSQLKALGFYNSILNGRYDDVTAAAVKEFQVSEEIEVNGRVNFDTLELLYKRYSEREDIRYPYVFPILKGTNNLSIREIGTVIKDVLEYYYGFYDLEVSSFYSDELQKAVDLIGEIFGLRSNQGITSRMYSRLIEEKRSIESMAKNAIM